jgi:hypothetical protein
MKTLILAAFAALSLTAVAAQAAQPGNFGTSRSTYHQGPYDNTGNGPGETGLEGGGG